MEMTTDPKLTATIRAEVFSALAEGLPEELSFFGQDVSGRITYASPGVSGLVGYQPAELIGNSCEELLTDAPVNAPYLADGSTRGVVSPHPIVCEVRHRDGSPRALQIWKTPIIRDGVAVGVAGVARGIDQSVAGLRGVSESERCAAETGLRQLTAREWDVLDRVVAGWTNKKIARQLNVSQRTVEARRSRIQSKLGVRSVAEMVRAYLIATTGASH